VESRLFWVCCGSNSHSTATYVAPPQSDVVSVISPSSLLPSRPTQPRLLLLTNSYWIIRTLVLINIATSKTHQLPISPCPTFHVGSLFRLMPDSWRLTCFSSLDAADAERFVFRRKKSAKENIGTVRTDLTTANTVPWNPPSYRSSERNTRKKATMSESRQSSTTHGYGLFIFDLMFCANRYLPAYAGVVFTIGSDQIQHPFRAARRCSPAFRDLPRSSGAATRMPLLSGPRQLQTRQLWRSPPIQRFASGEGTRKPPGCQPWGAHRW
jgi:hypothetical protein